MDMSWLFLVNLTCVLCVAMVSSDHIHNDPVYPYEYIGDEDCVPYLGDEGKEAERWNKRVWNLTEPGSVMYGYIRVTEGSQYKNPMNCAIKVLAPPGYKLIARIPRIEIYHDHTGCQYDFMSVVGATNSLHYCGFGTVTHSIGSTSNWLIIRMVASNWEANHNYIGFSLYFTALHPTPCNAVGNTTYEFQCNGHCIPDDVMCDDRDNCGDWDDEKSGTCGLTEGAVIAISVVCVLVGGTIIFFAVYCIYSKQKEKRRRARRQAGVTPTMQVGNTRTNRAVVITPSADNRNPSAQTEPPPPYTPEAYVNLGLYTGENPEPNAQNQNGNAGANTQLHPLSADNVNVRMARASNVRPPMGEPPPLYTVQSTDSLSNGQAAGGGGAASGGGTTGGGGVVGAAGVLSSGVSFDDLPEKDGK